MAYMSPKCDIKREFNRDSEALFPKLKEACEILIQLPYKPKQAAHIHVSNLYAFVLTDILQFCAYQLAQEIVQNSY